MRVFSIFTILSILLFGCAQKSTVETAALVWIAGGVSQDSYLFELKYDGTIKQTSGNVVFNTETKEVFYGNNIKTRMFKPDSDDMSRINDLLLKIGTKEGDIPNPGNDSIDVFAYINEKLYWTPYQIYDSVK